MIMVSLLWADQPFPLVPTCKSLKPKASPDAIFIADGMANVHNSLIRCLNSMYQQAPYVSLPTDVKDLLLYAKFWLELVHHHHSMEEDELFPAVARIAGKQGIMDVNIEQHRMFGAGMTEFAKYVKACTEGEPFEERRFRGLIDSFGTELSKHLGDEIVTLLALDVYDIKAVREEYDNFDSKMRSGPKVCSYVYTELDFSKAC
jgi:hemerythrin-like domain-containing protein